MASVYILYSPTLKRYYTGSCQDFTQRLAQHINKEFSDSFTAKADDWTVFLHVENLGYGQARSIEPPALFRVFTKQLNDYNTVPAKLHNLERRDTNDYR